MSPPPGRRRWPHRLALVTAVLGGILALITVGVRFSLPALVLNAFTRGTAAVGFQEASIRVDRADFSGLRVGAMALRRGGLEVTLDRVAAEYSVAGLIRGHVKRVTLDGLSLTLDLTKPRRGLWPDAVDELLAQIGGSDEPLVWPVDELTLDNCRLNLILPTGLETFPLSGSAITQPDGRVAFKLRSARPELDLAASAAVRTETMDGDLGLEQLRVQPEFVLALLGQLGVWHQPGDLALAADPVEISGTATLKSGALATYAARLQTARLHAGSGDLTSDLTGLEVNVAQTPGATLSGGLHATLAGRGEPWSVGPTPLQVSLDEGTITARLDPATITWGELASMQMALAATVGIPALGGAAHATVKCDARELLVAGQSLSPFAVTAAGWIDRIAMSSTELKLADDSPAVVHDLAADITEPLGAARTVEFSANVEATAALAKYFPAGWRLVEPVLPVQVARLHARLTPGENGVGASAEMSGGWPRLVVASGEQTFTCTPSSVINLALASSAISLSGAVEASDVASTFAKFPPGVRALKFGFEAPHTSLTALGELAAGRVPKDELEAKISGTIVQSETRGDAYVAVHHYGEAAEWSAQIWGMLDNVSGAWAGATVSGLRSEVTVDSGRLPDARFGEWLRAPELVPLVRSILPQTKVDVSLTAASVERPGAGRSEWSGLWLQKPPRAPDHPPLEARLAFSTGVLRTGPETLEQPEIKVEVAGTLDDFSVAAKAQALLEGSRLALNATQRVRFDWNTLTAAGEGPVALEPITLANSDIVSRWAPGARGVAVTATLGGQGTLTWTTSGQWDGTANLALTNGTLNYPDQGLLVEGVHTALALTSLRDLRTDRAQPIGFARLAIGKVEVTNASARVSADGVNRVSIDALKARVFGGDVAVGSFTLVFPAPDVGIALEFEGVDAGELARQIEIFKGTVTGKLRGKLPVGLLAGHPYFGEGFLELDPRYPASFSMDARGLFTTDLPNQTTKDKMVRLPYEVLEEALGQVTIHAMRLDFFRHDTPGTPIRIEFSGESNTRRARVPLDIVTRVNGSVPEALNFLFRLATL